MLVPYNSPNLAFANKASTSASASPFVVAIIESGLHTLPGFLNACILVFVFSAANSDLYISSRTLYGLAKEGDAPQFFAYTNRYGVPVNALTVSTLLACIAFMNIADDSKAVFEYFVNLVTIFGILTWISILVTHIHFVRARRAQRLSRSQMRYASPLGISGSYFALGLCIAITIFKNFDVFIHNPSRIYGPKFDYRNFITGYIGIPLYLGLILGCKMARRTKGYSPAQVDLYTGRDAIDKEEQEYLARKAAQRHVMPANWFYGHFVAWLF